LETNANDRCFLNDVRAGLCSLSFLLFILLGPPGFCAEVGQTVEVRTFGNNWVSGTILGKVMGGYKVHTNMGDFVIPDSPNDLRAGGSGGNGANGANGQPGGGNQNAAVPQNQNGNLNGGKPQNGGAQFGPGGRVEVRLGNQWYKASVIQPTPAGFLVRLDEHGRGAGPGLNELNVANVPEDIRAVQGPDNGPPPDQGANWNQNNNAQPAPDPPAQKAAGKPPSGCYSCGQISDMHFVMFGQICINGNTYTPSNGSNTYSLAGGGNINWNGGLAFMPDGYQLTRSYYAGLSAGGKPQIKVQWLSPRNAAETIDCNMK